MKISVVGLGKLGACYAAFYADRGFSVIGVDTDKKKVDAINAGRAPVEETRLDAYIRRNRKRLSATVDLGEAVLKSDVTFIIVPTPSNKDGSFSVDYVTEACSKIGRALRDKKSYHLVSLVSTVLPGDSRGKIIPTLERASKKQCGKEFSYCYNPSLIAIGDVLKNLEEPDFLFLGAHDKKASDTLAGLYKKLYPDREPERMSIESVELAKIALNSYVTTKITFANMLGELCEHIPHAHVDEITQALGKDKRIGLAYFRSGLGYGGPCFPRDNFAFAHMAKQRGVETPIALAVHHTNISIPAKIAKMLEDIAKKQKAKRIGFLGVSYKPKTTLPEESQALEIATRMQKKGYGLSIFEPIHSADAKNVFGKKARYPKTLRSFTRESEVIFVSNWDRAFSILPKLLRTKKGITCVVDPWGMFNPKDFPAQVLYKAIGRK